MRIEPGCIPCIVNQSYISCGIFGITEPEIHNKILFDTIESLIAFDWNLSSPYFSTILQSIIIKYSLDKSPYKALKYKNLEKARKFIPILNEMINKSNDKLETAIKISIIGNAIDLGANPFFDLCKEIYKINTDINMNLFTEFRNEIENAQNILFIADNFEEGEFDRFLIEQLSEKKITYAVRSNEILNDMTIEDARYLKIDKLCKVIESGSIIAGTDLLNSSYEFSTIYRNADMIISKGQGNYETLSDENRRIYFLFKIKCNVIANKIGYPIGSGILFRNL
jgi:damage-control phosphatase, subfamily I